MQNSKRIKGINLLLERLPKEYHHWHLFGGNILKLTYEKIFDYEENFKEIARITLILSDKDSRYKIKLVLSNVIGNVHFDISNGFFSGLAIEDKKDLGFENENCFVLTSFEQDISFNIRCESISAELIN